VLVHCSLLGGIAFGETEVHVLPWWWMYCCCYGWNTVAGLFSFLSFSFVFLAGCICTAIRLLRSC
jgi:hypothetical protein